MSCERVIVIPAAGTGSRLGSALPKILTPVADRPMLDHLLDLYSSVVQQFIVVVNRASEAAVRAHGGRRPELVRLAVQPAPTGMLDAITAAEPLIAEARPEHVWITWADQVAVHPATVQRLLELSTSNRTAALVLPTVTRRNPYTHLERDSTGRIVSVRERREGDRMPEIGESEIGLFSLTAAAVSGGVIEFARQVKPGAKTGERNFLPFIPWIARQAPVVTFPCVEEIEAVGVNTREELALVARHLMARRGTSTTGGRAAGGDDHGAEGPTQLC